MLLFSWKKTVVSKSTVELSKSPPKEPAVGRLEQVIDDTDKPQLGHAGHTKAPIAATRTDEPVENSLPTHPLSPGVLSQFPPFKYAMPPVRPQPRPLQENHSPLTPAPSCGRIESSKKDQPSLLTLSRLASAGAKIEARGGLTSAEPQN